MRSSLSEKYSGYVVGVVIGLLSTVIAPAGLSTPAFGSTNSFDVTGAEFRFNDATVFRSASPTASPQEFEPIGTNDQDASGSDNTIGANLTVGDYIDYFNVASVSVSSVSGSVIIDARVKVVAIQGMRADPDSDDLRGLTNSPGFIEAVDEEDSNILADNYQITTKFEAPTSTSDAFVEYEIQFFRNLSTSPVAISLSNLALTIIDIDARQFVELAKFTQYFVSSDTFLSVSTVSEFTRFADKTGDAHSGTTSSNQARVTVKYTDAVHSVNLRLGIREPNNSSGTFDLNFALAESTWTAGVAPAPIESPVIAASRPTFQAPRNVPYEGPLNLRHSGTAICSGGDATITGLRLDTIKEVTVAGKPTTFEMLADGNLKYSLKDVAAGKHQVKFWVPINGLYLTDQITVSTCSTTPVATAPGAFEASRLFANYRGDRGPVIARDRAAITAFINQYKGITTVRCVGSTSGVPAKRTDPALARARAKNACDIVKTLVPNATYTLETSTGKGVGQRFRSVTVFISGTN